MKSSTKKVFFAIVAAILLVSLTIGGTIAYLSKTSKVKNVFTVGKVAVELNEGGEGDPDDGTTLESGDREFPLEPQATIKKNPKITVGSGSMDSYVFIELNPVCTAKKATGGFYSVSDYLTYGITDKADGTNASPAWAKVPGSSNSNVWYIKYTKADADVTYSFFKDGVVTATNFDNTLAEAAAADGAEISITVFAGAIQDSDDFKSALDAWKTLAGADETLTK